MFEKLNIGETVEVDVLVTRMVTKTGKNNSSYQQLTVRDTDGVEAKINHFDTPLAYEVPVVLNLTIQVNEYQGNKTYHAKSVAPSQVEMQQFMPQGSIDVKKTYKAIADLLTGMAKTRPSLSRIVCAALKKETRFKVAAMNPEGAYARPSGVLEATYRLLLVANTTANIMGLDKDLMMAAACLYYIGYVDTVTDNYTATDAAVLLGAPVMTYAKVSNTIQALIESEAPELIPSDTQLLLSVLSGASSGTATFPEATALSYLSNCILNVEEQTEKLKSAQAGEVVKDRKGRPLFKRRDETSA